MSQPADPTLDDVSFQSVVRRLDAFWGAHGCALWHPHNTEVGAGTMNPATFLRALGPQPWRVGYLEPSVRPDDSRYGENPNRLQTHRQYQVILKPDPGDPQEVYLRSLEATGIDTARNDVRFVEDNWESPALGAWGLGWEVWLNGLEITQFTYFQQVGGIKLDPVSVELTYGLERILMALQDAGHFKDLRYGPGMTFGEAIGRDEYEMSAYYLDEADPERHRQLFDLYEAEARQLLGKRLPIPAYQFVLKCSHTFNVLDARGVVGVVERARYFKEMRELAHDVAAQWLEHLTDEDPPTALLPREPPVAVASVGSPYVPVAAQPLLLEVGTEELPPGDVDTGITDLQQAVLDLLAGARIDHGAVHAVATPRRLAVIVDDLAPRQRSEERVVRGPATDIAFDAAGQPTKAALGFARGQGVEVDALQRRTENGREHLFFVGEALADPTPLVLQRRLGEAVTAVKFDRSMRWGAGDVTFSRPIRWLLALHGGTVVPFAYAGLVAGRTSRGLRAVTDEDFEVPAADAYL
ncbi:MAG: glycine--tRNA ligase subunit alpha, partial [Egibacteraceae bacterium]